MTTQTHETHAVAITRGLTRTAVTATLHCLTGCAIGEVLGMILATWWDVNGLPALPAISLGFLLPNADLLWARLRAGRVT